MRDHDFFCIWNDSLEESKKEFAKEFRVLTSEESKEGLYTFIFSRYKEYRITTEVVYSIVYKSVPLFLWQPHGLILYLDHNLQVIDGDSKLMDDGIMQELYNSPNIEYLGFIVGNRGNSFEIFTLSEPDLKAKSKYMFDNGLLNIENISVSDEDLINASLEYLDHRIETFHDSVDKVIEGADPFIGMDENPYINRYYDAENDAGPLLRRKRELLKNIMGDKDV